MLDHPIIDIALGLVLFYVVLSLVASAVQEWIASLFALRSKNLHEGIRNLVGSESARLLYRHPLVKNLAKENKFPSYIAPETMSTVLLEVLAKENAGQSYVACTAGQVREMVGKIPAEHPLKEGARGLRRHNRRRGCRAAEQAGRLARRGHDPRLRLVQAPRQDHHHRHRGRRDHCYQRQHHPRGGGAVAKRRVGVLRSPRRPRAPPSSRTREYCRPAPTSRCTHFPSAGKARPVGRADLPKLVMGWVITIAAISLGAPFWFDLLGKVANLRGSGGKTGGPSRRATS